jgi:hypothetical protein
MLKLKFGVVVQPCVLRVSPAAAAASGVVGSPTSSDIVAASLCSSPADADADDVDEEDADAEDAAEPLSDVADDCTEMSPPSAAAAASSTAPSTEAAAAAAHQKLIWMQASIKSCHVMMTRCR